MFSDAFQQQDVALWQAIHQEAQRQVDGLEMIASENYTSPAVLACQGSILTNKYAEGYPGKRYYGGCEFVDQVEELARERLCRLFGAEFANVQPHSGAQANMAVFLACLQPDDLVLSMDLAHGGHLTHGSSVNFSGKLYQIVHYGVDPKTYRIDYDQVEELAKTHRPKLILAGASAYPRQLDFARFGAIAKSVDAYFMVDMAHIAGLVAAGLHPNPLPYADFVTSTTHKTLRGPRGGFILTNNEWSKKINSAVFPGIQGGPLMHVIAGKAAAFGEALTPAFQDYAAQTIRNAQVLATELAHAGFRILTDGTDNHLMLVDVTTKEGLTGKIAEETLDQAGITVNKNMLPFDSRKPMDPSGIRIGTPSLTTRGMKETEMKQIAGWIHDALLAYHRPEELIRLRNQIRDFARSFPVPGISRKALP